MLMIAVALLTAVPYCKDAQQPNASRCFAILENSGVAKDQINLIMVDNASSMPNTRAADLVLTADRSTQDGSPNTAPMAKGLMRDGDRVAVTDRYLAWFDCSEGDGVQFGRPYGPFRRACELTGLWTLNPETKYFRFARPSPDGSNDVWARNELIPGSASPNREQLWWDPYGPPVEHTFAIKTGNTFADLRFFSYTYVQDTPRSEYRVLLDGSRDEQGVHYSSQAYMTSWTKATDVDDDEDAQDIKNRVQATLEYICRPDDIVVVWRIMPTTKDVILDNIFIALWLAYAGNEDDTSCDVGGPGQQWPRSFSPPLYARSSMTLRDNWKFSETRAGTVAKLELNEPPCNRRFDGTYPDYHNNSLNTLPLFGVQQGSWIEFGESASIDSSRPAMRITVLDTPGFGRGTTDDPISIPWLDLSLGHENIDGTIVAGPSTTGPKTHLRAKTVYQSVLSLRPLP